MIIIFPDGHKCFDDEYESWMGDDFISVSEESFDI